MNWFERRPLFGQRILVTRTRQQASDLSAQLTNLGAQVTEVPTIELAPPDDWDAIDQTLQRIPAYDWIVFTSANGVRAAWDRLRHLTFDARHFGASHIAAIGSATAKALHEIGIYPDLLPEKFVGEELAAALKQHLGDSEIRHQRFLLLRADIARPALKEELEKLGAQVEDVAIYRTVRPDSLPPDITTAIEHSQFDWVTFTAHRPQKTLGTSLPRPACHPCKSETRLHRPHHQCRPPPLPDWSPTIEATRHDIQGVVEAITPPLTLPPTLPPL